MIVVCVCVCVVLCFVCSLLCPFHTLLLEGVAALYCKASCAAITVCAHADMISKCIQKNKNSKAGWNLNGTSTSVTLLTVVGLSVAAFRAADGWRWGWWSGQGAWSWSGEAWSAGECGPGEPMSADGWSWVPWSGEQSREVWSLCAARLGQLSSGGHESKERQWTSVFLAQGSELPVSRLWRCRRELSASPAQPARGQRPRREGRWRTALSSCCCPEMRKAQALTLRSYATSAFPPNAGLRWQQFPCQEVPEKKKKKEKKGNGVDVLYLIHTIGQRS
jgi:hypothetical protein